MAGEPPGDSEPPAQHGLLPPQPLSPVDANSPSSAFTPTPPLDHSNRRSSFSSSDSRLARYPSAHSKHKQSTLPSIRSLKNKFLGALGAGSGTGRRGPKVLKGDEARKPIRIVSATAVGGRPGGLKGFGGPAGAPGLPLGTGAGAGGMPRSASTPASLASLAAPAANGLRPPIEPLPPMPMLGSVDSMLSAAAEAERSPSRPVSVDTAGSYRHQRGLSAPADPTSLSPYASPQYRPLSSHPSLPSAPVYSPSAAPPLPLPRIETPLPEIKEPKIRPISSDFSRRPSAPLLLALRQQQQRDSLDVERSLSRQSGGAQRHSRILPGASLPAALLSDLQRSKSLGDAASTSSAEDRRGRHWSVQPPALHPPLPLPDRASWQGLGGSSSSHSPGGSTRPGWGRSYSAAPDVTPPQMHPGEESPELREGEREEHRGRSLSALLGQARQGLGLGGLRSGKDAEKEKDEKERETQRERRPSKPFPGGFEEVPYRPSIDASAFPLPLPVPPAAHPLPPHDASLVSPTNASPAAFARPLSLPAIVKQHRREVSLPDTPPPSARLQNRRSDSSLIPGAGASARQTSVAHLLYDGDAPPLPPSELTLTLQLQLEANPSVLASPPARSSSLPSLEVRKSKSAIDLVPSPSPGPAANVPRSSTPTEPPPAVYGAGVVHASSPVYDLTGARATVAVSPTPARPVSDDQPFPPLHVDTAAAADTEPHRTLSLSGRSFAEVIEERNRGGKALDSPLGGLIEELKTRSRANSAQNSPRSPGVRSPGGLREELVDSDEDDDELLDVDSPDFRRKDSQGDGANPFMLAAYLDSPVSSPGMGKRRRSNQAAPPMPSPLHSFQGPASAPPAVPSFTLHPSPSRTPTSTPPTAHASHFQPPPPDSAKSDYALSPIPALRHASSSLGRSLTLDQMEREIARMEAELALSGRPHSFYDDSTPKPGDIAAFASPAMEGPDSLAVSTTSDLGLPLTPSSSVPESPAPSLALLPADPAALSQVTPRTARRWSILEIEKAYERMKRMLGSSASSTTGSAFGGGRAYAASDITERDEELGASASGSAGEGSRYEEGEGEREMDVESALDEALAQARGFTGRQDSSGFVDTFVSSSSSFDHKPLPGIPPPTPTPPSPPSERLATSTSTLDSADAAAHAPESTPPTSVPETAHAVSLKASIESLAPPTPLNTRESRLRQLAPSPSLDSLRLASSSGHKRKGSDTSSVGGIRKLVLPASNQNRLRTKATTESLRALHTSTDEAEDSDDAKAARRYSARSTPPVSPRRPGGVRASSRLSASGPLRSAVGRNLQRQAGEEGEEENVFSSSFRREREPDRERAGLSVHRLVPPSGSSTYDAPSRDRDPRRRSNPGRISGTEAASWYPQTPHRHSSAAGGAGERARSDSQSTSASVGLSAARRRTSADDDADEESLASGLEDSELMANASVNMANIRGMDKLEIFFKYTSARADLEKAELERDALLDALRETRSTLADIRRQRDLFDSELKRERALTRQVKKHLGSDPDRYADKLDNLVDGRQMWEQRAKDALDELELARDELEATRRELVEGKEREEQLERENVMLGARLAAAEMGRSEYSGSPTLQIQVPVPSGLPSSSPRDTPPSSRHASLSSDASAPPAELAHDSPAFTMSRSTSNQTAIAGKDDVLLTPSVKLPRPSSQARDRHASKDSFASSSSEIAPPDLADVGSPLMGQQMVFGPKSSFGSTASPLKSRSTPPPTTGSLRPHRGQFSSLRFPARDVSPSHLSPSGHRLSTTSTDDSDYEDEYADRSFDSGASFPLGGGGENGVRLRQRDEAFLADLTAEVPSLDEAGAGEA
ncbi:hypothetical protein JCM10207_008265 [Rhodosporidiobolus poonsookiae]